MMLSLQQRFEPAIANQENGDPNTGMIILPF